MPGRPAASLVFPVRAAGFETRHDQRDLVNLGDENIDFLVQGIDSFTQSLVVRRVDGRPLHDYVCLYFNPKNPMLSKRRDHQDDIVILCLDRQLLEQSSTFFTDGNAAGDATESFNDPRDLKKLDWDCIRATYWNDFKDGKRKRCAEILVPDVISFDEVREIRVHSQLTKTRLGNLMSAAGRQATPIHINSGMYF